MFELNFRMKISGGKKLSTIIDAIPQSVTGDKAIKLQNGKEISEKEFSMTKSEDTPQKHFRYSKCLRCKTENRHSLNLRNTDMLHLIRDKEESPIEYEFCKRCKLLTRQITVAFTEVKL